jgi:RNA polymerase sigma-70 factor (family 1)
LQNQSIHTEEALFISFQRGEERGFKYFFDLYAKPLVYFASTITNSKETAEDIVEDCFVKLWEKREMIASASTIKPYLYTSVRNRALDVLKKHNHARVYEEYVKKTSQDFVPDVQQIFIHGESLYQVYLAVERLPARYRKVFHMFYLQGKEIKEIASELNLPVSTVKSQKIRTLKLLKKQLPHLGFLLISYFSH